ncbi:MAG: hypothetical protein QOH46_2849 [Solirubrobacteraceae bacterium]|nr:hypothetical protein [Solirubrobacteraceae bacterium]
MVAPPPSAPELARLHVGRAVVLDLEEEAIDCRVEDIAGNAATIRPDSVADAGYIPSLGRSAGLVFHDGGTRVRLDGAVHRAADEGRLRFVAGNSERLPPRRQSARVGAELAVELTALGASGEPAGDARRVMTVDVSLGGVGVSVGETFEPPGTELRFALELAAAPPITGEARVMRVDDGVAGLEFSLIAPSDLARLAHFLIASRAAPDGLR